MDADTFKKYRERLKKTQKELAQLLGTSLKAVQSYEQGWRSVPLNIERQMYFLISRIKENRKIRRPCWKIKNCPNEIKKNCPAWEFQLGNLCWFINGTVCCGDECKDWTEKINCCKRCVVLSSLL